MPNEKVYIHEFIDIIGHNRARYLHHMTANWCPVARAERDQLLAVDGRLVSELGMTGAIDAIRGPEGTTVRLTVRRDGVTREVDVPRRLIRG